MDASYSKTDKQPEERARAILSRKGSNGQRDTKEQSSEVTAIVGFKIKRSLAAIPTAPDASMPPNNSIPR